ncbi:MAG TPA: hypothetical protein VFH97_05275 [Gemmatimonadales bacterium]|nr:hypothetical protein [Gemmatimonadales bacterium]
MAILTTPAPAVRVTPAWYVLGGGLLVGTIDIVYACVFWALKAGVPARRILQSVSAGLLGTASFDGGTATAALGLALHFFNAVTMSVVYYLASGRLPALARRPVLWGGLYGLGIYAVMNYVVIPLSAARPGSRDPLWVGLSIAVHVFLIGMPIAFATRLARRAGES